jgi:hypothetical protein
LRAVGDTVPIPNPGHCCACAAEEERHADRATIIEAAVQIANHGNIGELREAAEQYLMMLFKLPSFK